MVINKNIFVWQKSSGASGSPFPGCGFTVLDVTGGANMAALKGKVTLDKLPCVQKIRDHIRTLEGSVYASIEIELFLKVQSTFISLFNTCKLYIFFMLLYDLQLIASCN